MGAVTYPHGGVERRLNETFVAWKPQTDQHAGLAKTYGALWTPAIFFVDSDEVVHHRVYGYHPPEEMEHLLHIGLAKVEFGHERYREAAAAYQKVTEDPQKTALVPEALYWLGVALYKAGDKEALARTWSRLLDHHPNSLCAKRASVIRPAPPATAAA